MMSSIASYEVGKQDELWDRYIKTTVGGISDVGYRITSRYSW